MADKHSSTIVKNTWVLYVRSFVTLALSIYTSRVLLSVLGIEDYGIYNLIGGTVGIFASLKVIFASAVQRFLNYEKGKGNKQNVRKVFSMSIMIHWLIAIAFAVIVEIVGIWLITHKLVIPTDSMHNAIFVFHCSVLTTIITILSIPYDAVIIANEKINVFAWITILEVVLKLVIVFLIPIFQIAHLKSYALLVIIVALVIRLIEINYSRRFAECRFMFFWEKGMFKDLMTFAGWNFFGNTAFTLVNEGLNLIFNIFGGVTANAARGVAYQIRNAYSQLSSNLLVASQPYIVQQSASVDKNRIFLYINQISKIVFLIIAFTALPVIVYCEQILDIWLVETPAYAAGFVRIILIYLVIRALHGPIDLTFKAYGKLGKYQIIDAASLMLSLPISYMVMKIGFPLYSVFVVVCIVEIVNLTSILLLANKMLGFNIGNYFRDVVKPSFLTIILFTITGAVFFVLCKPDNFFELTGFVLLLCSISLLQIYFIILNNNEKSYLHNYIQRLKINNK